MPQLLPAPLLMTEQLTSLAMRLYSIPAELPLELTLDKSALLVCLAVDTFALVLLPITLLLSLVSIWKKWNRPTLVFSKSAVMAPPPLNSEKSFSMLAKQLTRGGVAESVSRPRMCKDVAETFDIATAPGTGRSARTARWVPVHYPQTSNMNQI
jgi:hypothetical protein